MVNVAVPSVSRKNTASRVSVDIRHDGMSWAAVEVMAQREMIVLSLGNFVPLRFLRLGDLNGEFPG